MAGPASPADRLDEAERRNSEQVSGLTYWGFVQIWQFSRLTPGSVPNGKRLQDGKVCFCGGAREAPLLCSLALSSEWVGAIDSHTGVRSSRSSEHLRRGEFATRKEDRQILSIWRSSSARKSASRSIERSFGRERKIHRRER